MLSGIRALVVDVTPENVGRDPDALVALSVATDVDIVMGCGPYVAGAPMEDGAPRSAAEWHRALLHQLESPPPRPSVIGEIGTSDPITDGEREALIGAIRAQRDTRVPLTSISLRLAFAVTRCLILSKSTEGSLGERCSATWMLRFQTASPTTASCLDGGA